MADPTARALALVASKTATTPTSPSQREFAARIVAILQDHGDIASEATWQQMAQLIAQEWVLLNQDQPPLSTWTMLSRCCETILKVRRGQKQDQGHSGELALEAFRSLMGEVMGEDRRQ